MTSDQIRQSFLDFFQKKNHTIVPSASLMPTSPNLLFTNAGMNQFVPYFLEERKAPYPSAADTQKCIRAGGKHNDLDDVGFDTYHHTFFEMLGNWSFGDYFKKEAIEWAWELITKVWGFPKERLYATVYKPADGDPAEFDTEAYDMWKAIFEAEGMDPEVHIVTSGKKDNFWMMGETGPCGPCSELHIDLTPNGDTKGSLVNMDSVECIEIWNLVFIQFNANQDGTFSELPSRHIDTGMGFERVAGIFATTKNFTDFSNLPSNYNSDLFSAIFDYLSELSGETYQRTIPSSRKNMPEQEFVDFAFRVLADHIRTLSFSIADGILPGNEGRNYVLRRILRRAVMFGKKLKLPSGFFAKMIPALVDKMGSVFPALVEQQEIITKVITSEENAFDKTLDRGLVLLKKITDSGRKEITGKEAFTLYDTYGFPLDLTEIIALESGITVDAKAFEVEMEAQRELARSARKTTVISVKDKSTASGEPTIFNGFDNANLTDQSVSVVDSISSGDDAFLVFDKSPFYAEKGGQIGDTGEVVIDGVKCIITETILDDSERHLHKLKNKDSLNKAKVGTVVIISVNLDRRGSIQRHHSATHLLNWALRKVLGTHVKQAGSLVLENRLRFDFSHFQALTDGELTQVQNLVNEQIILNASVETNEVPISEKPEDVIAFFGDKYGDVVRVVDIGGYSKELCGGTHVSAIGEIGYCQVVQESAISAGTRRIEAIAGGTALNFIQDQSQLIAQLSKKLSCPSKDILSRFESLLEQKDAVEKELKKHQQKGNANLASTLATKAIEKDSLKWVSEIVENVDPKGLRPLAMQISQQIGEGVVILVSQQGEKASLVALCSKEAISKGNMAGNIIKDLTTELGGRGGGKPDFAMGGSPSSPTMKDVLSSYLNK